MNTLSILTVISDVIALFAGLVAIWIGVKQLKSIGGQKRAFFKEVGERSRIRGVARSLYDDDEELDDDELNFLIAEIQYDARQKPLSEEAQDFLERLRNMRSRKRILTELAQHIEDADPGSHQNGRSK